ncbi:MAG: hypothetical protein NVSMB64_21970 [Candidatus Velthaea sp.]
MKTFVLCTYGFETPTDAIMEAWGTWFASIGDKLVSSGGPFMAGKEVTREGTVDLPLGRDSLTGYVVIHADSLHQAEAIAKACPMITSVRIYETMNMG